MKKKFAIIGILLITTCTILHGQTQQGYVRTLERPYKPSVALEGVTVRVVGVHNAVVSGSDGSFQMPMNGKRNGDSYSLLQVQKNGYQLADQGVVGRKYAFSDRVPITIVMVSTAQLEADKQRISNAAYQIAEQNYHQKLIALEQQLSDSIISEDVYRTKLHELQENLEQYQGLIESLANHYAHIDYALLNDKERDVNFCIEHGELEKADSLLSTMFNPLGVVERNREALVDANRRLTEGQVMMDKAQNDLDAILRQQEKDAEYLYQLYTIALGRFDNEKARYYIETRAKLDTTNIVWQSEAGNFVQRYISDFISAKKYYEIALRQAIANHDSLHIASSLTDLGTIYDNNGKYDSAIVYYQHSLEIQIAALGSNHLDVATSYGNIGYYYFMIGEYDTSLILTKKSIQIDIDNLGENNTTVAANYNNLGSIYNVLGDYEKALLFLEKVLKIRLNIYGIRHPDVALAYNNIAGVYNDLGDYSSVLQNLYKAVSIYKLFYGEKHPDVAMAYNNIGGAFEDMEILDSALFYYNKALSIRLDIFGESHPDVAISYNNLGHFYHYQKQFDTALKYYNMALSIFLSFLGPEHPASATCYQNIGVVYNNTAEYDKAIDYLYKALAVKKVIYGENHPSVGIVLYHIGFNYDNSGNPQLAKEFYSHAYSIFNSNLGSEHPRTITVRERLEAMR